MTIGVFTRPVNGKPVDANDVRGNDNAIRRAWGSYAIQSVSGNATLDETYHTVLVDATSAARTITLPAAASVSGRVFYIKKIDSSANAVTVDGNGAETIDGVASATLGSQWEAVTVQSNGTAWFIL